MRIPIYIILLLIAIYLALPSCTVTQKKKICNTSGKECFYIKWYARGLNYDELFLTKSWWRSQVNKAKDHHFEFESTFFYGFDGKELVIYCSEEPQNAILKLSKDIKIRYVVLDNPGRMELFKGYKEKGLDKFPE